MKNHHFKYISYFLSSFILLIFNHSLFADSTFQKPNIVFILADDVALMDFGVYGGEAATPNIDKLANKGTIFTNYHTSPMCAPSRAMLLTGYDSHLTGVPNLPLFLPPEYVSKPGYEGILNTKVKTVATRLKENGYRTYMTGKWHLGHTKNTLPSKRGFDRTFILDASGADNYEHKAYLPTQSKPPWFEDGQAIDLPADFYSSRTLVDKMIGFMEDESTSEAPFFAYLAFQAVHIPVQAPKEFIDKYEGVYDKGWGEIRKQRFAKAKQKGLIPANTELGDMLPVMQKWENLSAADKKLKAKSMAVNAAMLEAMDFHIGRYMQYLQQKGELENTVFVITSDNGPEASDPSLVAGFGLWMKAVGYHRDYDKLGERGSWNYIGPEFASAAASPSAFFKFYAGEGGLRVPLIIAGKNMPTQQKNALSFSTDVTPTILNIAGISPSKAKEMPFTGKSLLPLINNETDTVYAANEPIGMEAAGQSALFLGDMKLVKNGKPYGDEIWRLYNLKTDPGETKDLAKAMPAVFQQLMIEYTNYTKKYGVLDMFEGYEAVKEVENKFKRKIIGAIKPWLIGLGVVLIGWFIRKRVRKKKEA